MEKVWLRSRNQYLPDSSVFFDGKIDIHLNTCYIYYEEIKMLVQLISFVNNELVWKKMLVRTVYVKYYNGKIGNTFTKKKKDFGI